MALSSANGASAAALLDWSFRLETERLLVCAPAADDVEDLHAALAESMDALAPWVPWADHVPTRAQTVDRIAQAIARFRAGSDFPMHVRRRSDGRLVCGVGVHRPDLAVPACEVGYWVRTPDGGHGYVTEAVRALVEHLFDACGVVRVSLRIGAGNTASRALAERLGFDLEAVLRSEHRHWDGVLHDTCVYARIRGESAQRR